MNINGKKVGIALTGSFCTYSRVFDELEALKEAGADIYTIFSFNGAKIDQRFGKSLDFIEKAKEISNKPPILTIEDAEPIGPKSMFDIMAICPCTGNTAAKLANGIVDTPALMAAKAHLRNDKPLVIGISTNDGLSVNLSNIGRLINMKNIYFIPFGQDNPDKKPHSVVSHMNLLKKTLESALDFIQLQPVILNY